MNENCDPKIFNTHFNQENVKILTPIHTSSQLFYNNFPFKVAVDINQIEKNNKDKFEG